MTQPPEYRRDPNDRQRPPPPGGWPQQGFQLPKGTEPRAAGRDALGRFSGTTQVCSSCGKEKPATHQYYNYLSRDKNLLMHICRDCENERKDDNQRADAAAQAKLTVMICDVCGEEKARTHQNWNYRNKRLEYFDTTCRACAAAQTTTSGVARRLQDVESALQKLSERLDSLGGQLGAWVTEVDRMTPLLDELDMDEETPLKAAVAAEFTLLEDDAGERMRDKAETLLGELIEQFEQHLHGRTPAVMAEENGAVALLRRFDQMPPPSRLALSFELPNGLRVQITAPDSA